MSEKVLKKRKHPDFGTILYDLLLGGEDHTLTSPMEILLNVVEPTETVARSMQDLANKAIGLSGCGSNFAIAIATSSIFPKDVEKTMTSSLEVFRTLSSMMGVVSNASECLAKMRDDRRFMKTAISITDEAVDNVVNLVFSLAESLKETTDKVVSAAIQASELQVSVGKIITTAQTEAATAAKREAEFRERRAEAEMMGDLDGFMEAHNYQQNGGSVGDPTKDIAPQKDKEDEDLSSVDVLLKSLSLCSCKFVYKMLKFYIK
jgi:hypothetical protein